MQDENRTVPSIQAAAVSVSNAPTGGARRTGRLRWALRASRAVAFLMLGLALPALLLWTSKQAIDRLHPEVTTAADLAALSVALPESSRRFEHGNDYMLLFSVLTETSAQRLAVQRLHMKIAVMHVGFAIACVGLLLLVFGVEAGGVEVGGTVGDVAGLNFKVASSGIAIFVLGASLAGAGGLLPIEHQGARAEFALGPLKAAAPAVNGSTQALLTTLDKELKTCDSTTVTLLGKARCRSAVLHSFADALPGATP